jgi:hypothetical protein
MSAESPAFAATIDRPTDVLAEDRGGIRILSLSRGKANAFSTEFAHTLHKAALAAQEDDSVRGVVLTSTNPKIFSAGFDLRKLAHATDEEFARFVRVFDSLFFDLFLLGKPLVVALTGHAVAGGALLASTADFRIASEGPGNDRPPRGHARDPRPAPLPRGDAHDRRRAGAHAMGASRRDDAVRGGARARRHRPDRPGRTA